MYTIKYHFKESFDNKNDMQSNTEWWSSY